MRDITLHVCIAICFSIMTSSQVIAEDLGAFEGAIWRFTLEPKNPQQEKLGGMFRVHNGVLYQKESPRDQESKKVSGTEQLVQRKGRNGAKLTRLNFTDLRAFPVKKNFQGERTPQNGIQGSVFMHKEEFGKWSGAFIAADGRHWNFSCRRVRE